MIDFWELSGRLLLMDPNKRKQDIYTTLLPIQSDGCILLGHAQTATLPFPILGFYNAMRKFFADTYKGADLIYSPVISMFALGEIGTMFFNQPFRDLFEKTSNFLRTQSNIQGKTDTGSTSFFYTVLMLLVIDRTTRGSVQGGKFLGLENLPSSPGDQAALTQLANDPKFIIVADNMCRGEASGPLSEADWTRGSASVLQGQDYGNPNASPPIPPIPFRHFRFVQNVQP
jgi:hypothetical protein